MTGSDDSRSQPAESQKQLEEQLRSVLSRLVSAEERERRRVAADLHDRIGQTLAVCKMKSEAARAAAGSGDAGSGDLAGLLGDLVELIGQAIQETRSLTFELCPPVLYELGLEAALEWLVEQTRERHGLPVRCEDDGQPKPLADDVRMALFRAASELLNNIVKHAGAERARVSIRKVDDRVQVEVEDDGRGFETLDGRFSATESGGFGLFSIRQRMEFLGGSVSIDSRLNRGTRVVLTAPLLSAESERSDAD